MVLDFWCLKLAVTYPENKTDGKTAVPEYKRAAVVLSVLWKRAMSTTRHS